MMYVNGTLLQTTDMQTDSDVYEMDCTSPVLFSFNFTLLDCTANMYVQNKVNKFKKTL